MALTYEEQNALTRDDAFVGRVKISGLHYMQYILNEAPSVEGHSARYRWAQKFAIQPEIEARSLTPIVVMDPAVQQAGAAITDAALQTAVEGTINKFF